MIVGREAKRFGGAIPFNRKLADSSRQSVLPSLQRADVSGPRVNPPGTTASLFAKTWGDYQSTVLMLSWSD